MKLQLPARILRTIALVGVATTLSLSCTDDDGLEDAADEVEDAAEDAADEVEDAVD